MLSRSGCWSPTQNQWSSPTTSMNRAPGILAARKRPASTRTARSPERCRTIVRVETFASRRRTSVSRSASRTPVTAPGLEAALSNPAHQVSVWRSPGSGRDFISAGPPQPAIRRCTTNRIARRSRRSASRRGCWRGTTEQARSGDRVIDGKRMQPGPPSDAPMSRPAAAAAFMTAKISLPSLRQWGGPARSENYAAPVERIKRHMRETARSGAAAVFPNRSTCEMNREQERVQRLPAVWNLRWMPSPRHGVS